MIKGHVSRRKELSLGADPEMFIFSGAKLVPAFEFLPAKCGASLVYWDGFQAEWKYGHYGVYCLNNLVYYTRQQMMELERKAIGFDPKAKLTLRNVVRIPQAVLREAHPRHVELGCKPSYNAYGMKGKAVYDPRSLRYRFAGGHMHFGTWSGAKPNYEGIVKTLDTILGVFSVGLARHLDNPIRREYYGLAGEYRKPLYDFNPAGGLQGPHYGVEYRALSNFWLASPAVMQLVWDLGRMCVRLSSSKHLQLWAQDQQETIETINSNDTKQAERIINRNEPMLRWLLKQSYGEAESIDKAVKLFYSGVEGVVKDPNDLNKNWHFDKEWKEDATAPWARWEAFKEEDPEEYHYGNY